MALQPLVRLLDRRFRLTENATTVRTEVVAGLTTFLTAAYIIFVQPIVLGAAGMDPGAVMVATCLGTAFATLLMAFMANYPVVVAPGMGHNFFFSYTVVLGMGVPWSVALGAVALAGVLTTTFVGFRVRLIEAIPSSLKHATVVGIGLLIALVGLEWAGVIVGAPGTLVSLGDLKSLPVGVALVGLATMAALVARGVRGAIVLGVLAASAVALVAGLIEYQGVVAPPPSLAPTFLQLDVLGAFAPGLITVILVFFFLDVFDSVGTLVGVAHQAGFMRHGSLPRAREALMADGLGTIGGALLGTSTVTSYVESTTGIAAGGRTGLTSMVVASLFLLSLVFFPLIRMVGGGVPGEGGVTLYPVIAPALIIVGSLMISSARSIAWEDPTEGLPAFLTMLIMPLAVNITEGLAFGFVSYSFLKIVSGRSRDAGWVVHVIAVLFLARFVALR